MAEQEWTDVVLDGLDCEISVKLRTMNGRPRLVGLRIEATSGGPGVISAEFLHGFPIQEAVRAALKKQHRPPRRDGGFRTGTPKDWTEVPRVPGQPLPREHFEFVASAYDMAIDEGQSPNRWIRELWGVSRATAHVWITKARELDLIDHSEPRPDA